MTEQFFVFVFVFVFAFAMDSITASAFEKAHVHRVYESIAPAFDRSRFCHWNAVKHFLDTLPPIAVVLDDGCGNGKYLRYEAPPNHTIVWVGNDLCENLLKRCAASLRSGVGLVQANGLNLPYASGTFDAVISIAVLHHLSTPDRRRQFLKEIARVLRVNGRALVTVWAAEQRHKRMKDWRIEPNGDAMIPWKDPTGMVQEWRYYHLFNKEAFVQLFDSIDEWTVHSIGYEYDNWYAVVEKTTASPGLSIKRI